MDITVGFIGNIGFIGRQAIYRKYRLYRSTGGILQAWTTYVGTHSAQLLASHHVYGQADPRSWTHTQRRSIPSQAIKHGH